MDKEQEIQEMIAIKKEYCIKNFRDEGTRERLRCGYFIGRHCDECYANALYDAGYRKADDVQKETAKEILDDLWQLLKTDGCARVIKEKAEVYGVEVEE